MIFKSDVSEDCVFLFCFIFCSFKRWEIATLFNFSGYWGLSLWNTCFTSIRKFHRVNIERKIEMCCNVCRQNARRQKTFSNSLKLPAKLFTKYWPFCNFHFWNYYKCVNGVLFFLLFALTVCIKQGGLLIAYLSAVDNVC